MVEILPEVPSFGTQFARNLGKGFNEGINRASELSGKMNLLKQKQMAEELAKGKERESELGEFQSAYQTVEDMEKQLEGGNVGTHLGFGLGPFGNLLPGGKDRAFERAKFAKMGQRLIPIVAAGVPIRNQAEFKEYSKIITDPTANINELKGALAGIKSILQSKIGGSDVQQIGSKDRPPLDSFYE